MQAILTNLRIAPKKTNLVADLVRRKKAVDALNILRFTTKKAAPFLRKLIASAVANAVNNFKQDREDLYIKEIIVTEGPTMKRGVPVSRGRVHPILKRSSHITVKLEVKAGEKKATKEPELKTETKTTAKTTVKSKATKSKK